MGLTLFSLITLIFLLMLSERLAIRIAGTAHIRVVVTTTFYSFEIKKKNNRKRHSRGIPISFLLNLVENLLPYTDVICRSSDITRLENFASPSSIIGAALAYPILLSYVRTKANAFELDDGSEDALDIVLIFSIYSLFISLIKASYYLLKKKTSRRKRNARGRNKRAS